MQKLLAVVCVALGADLAAAQNSTLGLELK
jgi:hypothetical protein